MGHDGARAAMIYQHATSKADHKIAAALTEQIEASREDSPADGLAAPSEPETSR
jgi:hypothetical protein